MKIRTVQRVDPQWLAREIGRLLKAERLKRKLTAQQLGDAIGITRSAISSYEVGGSIPSMPVLYNISLYFCIGIKGLLP